MSLVSGAKGVRRGIPLRFSLVLLTVLLVAAGLVVSGFLVTSAMKSNLLDRVDEGLTTAISTWAQPRQHPPNPDIEPPGPRRPPSNYFVQTSFDGVADVDPLISNDFDYEPNVAAVGSGVGGSESGRSSIVGPTTVASTTADGPQWRVVVSTRGAVTVVVATPLTDVNTTISRLVWLQLGIGAIAVSLLGGLGYLVVSSSLRPLRRVEDTAHRIADGNLTLRVPAGPENTEVGSLAASLNTMLAQIQSAFATTAASEAAARRSEEEMRRFIADASHELRTPVTSVTGFAELYRQGAVTDVGDAMSRIEAEAARMRRLVEDLLTLAKVDAGQTATPAGPVDLLPVVIDAVHAVRARAPERDTAVNVLASEESPPGAEASGPAVVWGQEDRLTQVVSNLLSNAVVHTSAEAAITVTLEQDQNAVILSVADTGPGIAAADLPHICERFYRGDTARSRDGASGSGLGLSIVAAIVEAHDGQIDVESPASGGAIFRIRLPRAR